MKSDLFRALQVLARCKPETLAEHTSFTLEVCREAVDTARDKVFWERLKRSEHKKPPPPKNLCLTCHLKKECEDLAGCDCEAFECEGYKYEPENPRNP